MPVTVCVVQNAEAARRVEILDGQLTWLVYMVGAIIGGHSSTDLHNTDGQVRQAHRQTTGNPARGYPPPAKGYLSFAPLRRPGVDRCEHGKSVYDAGPGRQLPHGRHARQVGMDDHEPSPTNPPTTALLSPHSLTGLLLLLSAAAAGRSALTGWSWPSSTSSSPSARCTRGSSTCQVVPTPVRAPEQPRQPPPPALHYHPFQLNLDQLSPPPPPPYADNVAPSQAKTAFTCLHSVACSRTSADVSCMTMSVLQACWP